MCKGPGVMNSLMRVRKFRLVWLEPRKGAGEEESDHTGRQKWQTLVKGPYG